MLGIKSHDFVARRGVRSLRRLTAGATVGVMVLAGGFFQSTLPAQAADFACTVTTEQELTNCIASGSAASATPAVSAGDSIDIKLGANIEITRTITIKAGDVRLTSDSGRWTLARADTAARSVSIFYLWPGTSLSVTQTIFDGKKATFSIPMIRTSGAVTLGDGVVVQNGVNDNYNYTDSSIINVLTGGSLVLEGDAQIINNNATFGAIGCYGAGASLKVGGDVLVSDNEATKYGGGAFFIGNGCQATFDGNAQIIDNSSAYYGGAVACQDAGTSLAVGGSVVVSGNEAYKGGAFYIAGGCQATFGEHAQIIDNNSAYYGGAVVCQDAGTSLAVGGSVVVSGNEATSYGGSFYIDGGCQSSFGGKAQITDNSSGYGGAVMCYGVGTSVMVTDSVVVSGNEAYMGGAFYIYGGCQSTFDKKAKITDNTVETYGVVHVSGNLNSLSDPSAANTSIMISGEVEFAGNTVTGEGVGGDGGYGVLTVASAHADISDDVTFHDNICLLGSVIYITYEEGAPNTGSASISGDVKIYNNKGAFAPVLVTGFPGGDLDNPTWIDISGNVEIYDNTYTMAGGIEAYDSIVNISGSVKIHDNTSDGNYDGNFSTVLPNCGTFHGGGGIMACNSQLTIQDSAAITGNKAIATSGGGINLAGPDTTLSLAGAVDISGNTADGDGGGIYIDPTVTSELTIPAGVTITGNTAGGDGGGIYLAYAQLPQLTVEAGATFTGNKAATVTPNRSPADDHLYAQKIFGTTWTSPLTQGYNNYDIAYHAAQIGLKITGALADEDKYFEGDLILWTYVITNNDDVDMTGVTFSDLNDPELWDLTALTCLDEDDNPFTLGEDSTEVLASGASVTCTATSKIRQADIDNTEAYNVGSVTGAAQVDPSAVTTSPGAAKSDQARGVALIPQNPQLTVEKTSSVAAGSKAKVGDQITFTITVTNTGNVALSGIEVEDGMDGLAVTCDGQDNGVIALAPKASITCKTDPYTVTQADAANGKIMNVATATGDDDVTGDGDVTIEVEPLAPGIHLAKRGKAVNAEHPKVDDVVTWTFEISNTGDADLTQVTIDDPQVSSITCTLDGKAFTLGAASTDVLPVDKTVECTGTSTVTQSDIDNTGATNTASVSGTDLAGKTASSGPVTAVAPLAQNPAYKFEKTAAFIDANNNGQADVGEQIFFTITLENQGNVTLNQVKITDTTMPDLVLTCVSKKTGDETGETVANDGSVSLPPGQTVECTSSLYTITADDAAAGSVANLATFAAEVGNPAPPVLRQPGDNSGQSSLGEGSRAVVPIAPQQQAPAGGWVAGPANWAWAWLVGAGLLAGVGWLLIRRRQAGEAG